jgi:hypothetical protein
MEQKFNLTIAKPCSEKFNKFRQTPQGGFCNSCQKEVIDFRKLRDEQIVKYFNNNKGNTCGYFDTSQLNRTITKTDFKQSTHFRFFRVAAIAFLSFSSLHHIQAQEQKHKIEVVQNENQLKDSQSHKSESQQSLLTGIVADASGPLPGANIILKGTAIGTSTDFDGEFEFPKVLKEGDVLVISFLGYATQEIVIKKEQTILKAELNINMKEDLSCFLMGEVEVNEVYKSKPTFWQRIKNIF